MSNSAFDDFTPSLTYDGTSGSVDVDTSREATAHADVSGITNKAQRYALIIAAQQHRNGVTVAELREKDGTVHHGRVSAALTNLHRDGRLVALKQRRNNCGIYVLPEFVDGRETRRFKPNRKTLSREDIVQILDDHDWHVTDGYTCMCGQPGIFSRELHRDHLADVLAEAMQ